MAPYLLPPPSVMWFLPASPTCDQNFWGPAPPCFSFGVLRPHVGQEKEDSGGTGRDMLIAWRVEGSGQRCGREERIPQRRKAGLFHQERKTTGWLGQICWIFLVWPLPLFHAISLGFIVLFFGGTQMTNAKKGWNGGKWQGVRKEFQVIFLLNT